MNVCDHHGCMYTGHVNIIAVMIEAGHKWLWLLHTMNEALSTVFCTYVHVYTYMYMYKCVLVCITREVVKLY